MKSTKWNRDLSSLAGGMLAMAFALVPDAVFAAKTVSSDYTLSSDEDWRADGVITVEEGVNVDLNGHVLYLAGLSGKGTFTTSVANVEFTDLGKEYISSATVDPLAAAVLFENLSYSSNNRINVSAPSDASPYAVTYTFPSAVCINCYKIRVGTASASASRAPKTWTLSASADNSTWEVLDSHDSQTSVTGWTKGETKTFVITNTKSYKYYKISFTGSNTTTYLEINSIQYGYELGDLHLANKIYIDPAQSIGFAAASNTVANSVDVVITGGKLPADIDLRGLNRKITLEGDLDLAGHRIFTRAIDGSGTLTSSQTAFADLTGSGTATADPDSHPNYPIAQAFDNSLSEIAYWNSFSNGTGVKIDYDFETAPNVNRYTIHNKYTNNSSARNQKTWKIYGSTNNTTWVELDSRADETFGDGVTRSFDFINENCYRYYRMHITAIQNGANAKLNVYELEYGVGGDNNGIVVDADGIAVSDTSSITVSSGNGVAIGDFTLANDLDTTGAYSILGTIDLAGHDLTVSKLTGSGTVTDSSTSATGTLHVVVDSGKTVANTTVSLTGNLKLSKEGAGTLTMTKDSQTYTGGTQVVEGTLTCGANGTATPLASGDITVESGGIFEMNGKNGYSSQQVILNGGTLMNSENINDSDTLCKLKLTADSTWTCVGTHYFGRSSDAEKTPTIDLNGHTLDVTIASGHHLRIFSTTITNGTFSVSGSGTFISGGSGIEARTVDFKVNCPLFINQALSVRNYESLWTTNNYDFASNTNRLSVYGTFTPTTTYFYGCTLMDGATIDLSGLSDTLSITSDSQYGLTTLAFADDATVYVDVGSRSLTSSSCLLSWTEDTQPSNLSGLSFKRPEGTERVYGIAKQDGGLYYTGAGLIILFR